MFTLITVKQLAKAHPALSEASVRWQIFRARDNGLEASGAIRRIGRRIVIVQERYQAWLDQQGSKAA